MTDTYLLTRDVLARYRISDRTLDRWIASQTLNFPTPTMINGRRYWPQSAIVSWEVTRRGERA